MHAERPLDHPAGAADARAGARVALAGLAARYDAFESEELPLNAALGGTALSHDHLFRESPEDHARRDRRAAALLDELRDIDVGLLAGQARATHRLLQRELEGLREQHAALAHLRPSLFPVAMDFATVFWANGTALETPDDADRCVARLAALPAALVGFRDSLAEGHRRGIRYPRRVLQAATANTRGLLEGDATASPWLGPFRRTPLAAHPAVRTAAQQAERIVATQLRPALRAHVEFMEGPLAESARDTLSCIQGPEGEAFYDAMVRHFTTTPQSAEAIHTLGLQEVARLAGEIEAVAAEAGFGGDVAGYRRFLATDPQFQAADAVALRRALQAQCKRIDQCIPAFFAHLPRATYGVDSMTAAASERLPPAYAQPAAPGAAAPGLFWVSALPARCPSWLHPALAVHEAWPGHLMHMALMQEDSTLPRFRRQGAVKYTACVEGWALYCEMLGAEMGLYTTPHERYGLLEMQMWRAMRLVVDTGIHDHGWRREQAMAAMREHLALDETTVSSEVDRYAALPAQALGYHLGGLAVRALRTRAEAALGGRFRLRDFHTAVTTAGAVTLPVLDELLGEWIAEQH